MSRKSLGVLALTLAFSTTLMAQSEPFLGIWEIDLERTSNYQRCCMDHPEGCLIIVFFNTGDNLDAT